MSSIPNDSPWRGAAAAFAQPLLDATVLAVQYLVENVYYMNCGPLANPRLNDVIYRSSEDDQDIRRRVFRWDLTPYQQVFNDGFEARRQTDATSDQTYFNLLHSVNEGGRPLDLSRPVTHAFVSTTNSSQWRPTPRLQAGETMDVYRYEINAPGGILVSETLGALNQFSSQEEICFISGIAPQYIRSAQLFRVTHEPGSRYLRFERADDRLVINPNFNPQSDPFRELRLRLPVVDYMDKTAGRKKLKKIVIPRPSDHVRERRQVVSDDSVEWYADLVVELPSYINSAFRSSAKNEAYLFMKDEYVLLNYAPGTTDDRIINGPLLIVDGFRSLSGTAFGEYGIDCAFDTDGTEAFIFCGEFCAYIDYAPGTTDDKILQGPHTITSLFPFFKGTVFEHGIDAAFRSSSSHEAYLFKGKEYALIDYNSKTLIAIRLINQGFYGLRGTIFESGIEAAFASHRTNEAYIFKEDQYALINFAPGTTDDYIIGGGVKKIVDNWPSLRPILPRTNRGLDDTSVAN